MIAVQHIAVRALAASSLLLASFNGLAQPATPSSDTKYRVKPMTVPCVLSVTPDTKIPWIEESELPDQSRSPMYFEFCSNIDNAWMTQSYPDVKYVPKRTLEHQARVNLFLKGIKDYIAADSQDWASYVNAWLGSTLPPQKIEREKNLAGNSSVSSSSYVKDRALKNFETSSKLLEVTDRLYVSLQGEVSKYRTLSISDLTSEEDCITLAKGSGAYAAYCKMGMATEKLCITPVDLQKAFENQPGYLFSSGRIPGRRPTPQELAKLGGQWIGYVVYVFAGPDTGKYSGDIRISFDYKPCASDIQINLTNTQPQGDKP